MAKLLYQGHASVRLTSDSGVVIYIDPFAGTGYDKPADLILVSHQHGDHNRLGLPARKPDCAVIQNGDILQNGSYGTFNVKGVTITGFPAENKNHRREESVGFIITVDGKKLYHAGDTSKVPEMATLSDLCLDYALLPIDGKYNMDEKEAAECAALIRAGRTIPIHMAPGSTSLFSEEKAAAFSAPDKLIVRPGEEITL
jgi:L-ascorbate metabolism protein UlaG (beta-lactamase superfamily)